MRFRQMFVAINMVMDHTASSPIMPQLDHASCIKTTELASPSGPSDNGVVLPLSTQLLNQQKEDVDQFKAQVEKTYDPSSVTMKHRKMQQFPAGYYVPPGTQQPLTYEQQAGMQDSNSNEKPFWKTWQAWALGAMASAVGLGTAITWGVKCFRESGPDEYELADIRTRDACLRQIREANEKSQGPVSQGSVRNCSTGYCPRG